MGKMLRDQLEEENLPAGHMIHILMRGLENRGVLGPPQVMWVEQEDLLARMKAGGEGI